MVPEEKLKQIAQQIRDGSRPTSVSVRELLTWFDAQRRGNYIVERIRTALSDAGLATSPDFEGEWIDGPIEFVGTEESRKARSEDVGTAKLATTLPVEPRIDPTNRIAKLAAANTLPTSVKPNDSVTTAITIMMRNDFSHLPVMVSDREVKGVISWPSIGSRLALGKKISEARECMEPAHIVSGNTSLFDAMDGILRNQYVLVCDETKRISGIVTTFDLSVQFRQLTEPFLLLGEIENHIRRIIENGGFTPEQLKDCRDPNDRDRDISRVSELSLGEYIRLLEKPDNWSQIKLPVDRKEFVAGLDRVRVIRNDVMHFDPDPIPSESLETLRLFTQFLQRLQSLVG